VYTEFVSIACDGRAEDEYSCVKLYAKSDGIDYEAYEFESVTLYQPDVFNVDFINSFEKLLS
jgi:hypothetical protein